jgi:hypothetical protein
LSHLKLEMATGMLRARCCGRSLYWGTIPFMPKPLLEFPCWNLSPENA